jgi:hypothetical protein
LQQSKIGADIKYQLLLSFAGLLLLIILAFFPPTVSANVSWRKPLVGSIFSLFCILGVLAVISPNACGNMLGKKKEEKVSDSNKNETIELPVLAGHHPTCGKFSAHIFVLGNQTFCAACIGLLIGGVATLDLCVLYFFGGIQITEYMSLVLLGSFGVGIGLFQFKFRSFARLLMNVIFVLGALLILIGTDVAVQSLFFDFFVICLIVFWLFTRISLSQVDHKIICSSCDTENCKVRN